MEDALLITLGVVVALMAKTVGYFLTLSPGLKVAVLAVLGVMALIVGLKCWLFYVKWAWRLTGPRRYLPPR